MEVKKEVKHFVQDISIKRSNVHFNFHFNFHERSELTPTLTPEYLMF